mgnify:FL=1
MPAAGRVGDKSHVPADAHGCPACPHPATGPATSGSPDVNINGLPALRVQDTGIHAACCGPNTWVAVQGSTGVFINARPAHRMGDADQHCGGTGKLVEGSPNVFIGGRGGGGRGARDRPDPKKEPKANLVIKVENSDSGQPLEGATVRISGPKTAEGRTDASGQTRFDNIPPGTYQVEANKASHHPTSAQTTAIATNEKETTAELKLCECTSGRKYAYAYKSVSEVIGVKAKIKTRYGKLCCESKSGTDSAYHVVYANVSNSSGSLIWAQTGFGRERNEGSTSISSYRYAEMKGSTYKVNYDKSAAPSEGSTHIYQCDLDSASGTWTFFFDGKEWQKFADPSWKGQVGQSVQWTGEIFNKQDDMPGTAADKCSVAECQYRQTKKDYTDADLVAGDVKSDDAAEWGSEWVSKTAFNIWDKKPIK